MAVTAQAMRARYASDSVGTASPGRLLTMIYDRLVRDLNLAAVAIVDDRHEAAHRELVHAQAIVDELAGSLDADAWAGGPGLAQLYVYLRSELVAANLTKDADRVDACRELVEPLRDAWHTALAEAGR